MKFVFQYRLLVHDPCPTCGHSYNRYRPLEGSEVDVTVEAYELTHETPEDIRERVSTITFVAPCDALLCGVGLYRNDRLIRRWLYFSPQFVSEGETITHNADMAFEVMQHTIQQGDV